MLDVDERLTVLEGDGILGPISSSVCIVILPRLFYYRPLATLIVPGFIFVTFFVAVVLLVE
jgi:hypothetical protein